MVFNQEGRRGVALSSIISNGAIISGSTVEDSIISPGVKVNSYCEIKRSIILHGCRIGRHARIQNAIIDKYNNIAENEEIGYDLEKDRQRFTVSPEGIVVIPKGMLQ